MITCFECVRPLTGKAYLARLARGLCEECYLLKYDHLFPGPAAGGQLDYLGSLYGVERCGENDNDFKKRIGQRH